MHDDEIREMHDDDPYFFYYSNFKQRLHSVHNLKQNKTKNEKNKKVKNKIKQMLFFESLTRTEPVRGPKRGRLAQGWRG